MASSILAALSGVCVTGLAVIFVVVLTSALVTAFTDLEWLFGCFYSTGQKAQVELETSMVCRMFTTAIAACCLANVGQRAHFRVVFLTALDNSELNWYNNLKNATIVLSLPQKRSILT